MPSLTSIATSLIDAVKNKFLRSPLAGKRILIVDDEPLLLQAIKDSFEGHGYKIQTATNGKSAINMFMKTWYDLIILDWSMPGFTGGDTLEKLQDRIHANAMKKILWEGRKVAVVIHSGYSLAGTTLPDTENLVVVDYWKKPMTPGQLAAQATAVLKRIEDNNG